jgi:L-fuconolactonase
MLKVDAHHHVWRIDRGDYFWISPDSPLHRDYGIENLRPDLDDIGATVLIQAAPTEAETFFLLESAAASNGLVRGVVGWTDLAASNAPQRVQALAAMPLVKGLRPMLGFIEETGWILRSEVKQGSPRWPLPACGSISRHVSDTSHFFWN